ncbi:MAG: septum formation initiator family protein [Eubacterium sp.]|nr:septum formation initiator family protein [Eubacterium sp.]
MAICVFAVAVTSVAYVNLQSELTIRQEQIAALESEISDLKIDNDTTYKRITTSVDLKTIRRKAKKLGMKYPKENQIVYYTIDNSDYMTQYSN